MGDAAPNAIIYCRLSRKGGRSVERQEEDGRQIAAERGAEVPDGAVFKETASASGFARKPRDVWKDVLDAIRSGAFVNEHRQPPIAIFWMEDRSSRDLMQAWEFVQVCKGAKVNAIVPGYDYDFSDPEDETSSMAKCSAVPRKPRRFPSE
jgi:DNA invertase Pin-like site-specific DNA recombinase